MYRIWLLLSLALLLAVILGQPAAAAPGPATTAAAE